MNYSKLPMDVNNLTLRLLGYYNYPNQAMKPEKIYIEEAEQLASLLTVSLDSLLGNPDAEESLKDVIKGSAVFIFKDEDKKLYAYFTKDKTVRITDVIFSKNSITQVERKYKNWFNPGDVFPINNYFQSASSNEQITKLDITSEILDIDNSSNHNKLGKIDLSRLNNFTRINKLQTGQEIDGVITNITDFGAFVDLGNATGLIHIRELAWKYVKNPNDIVSVGDKVHVKITSIDDQRIALSRKQLLPNPELLQTGDIVNGVILEKKDFGYIIDIGDLTALALLKDMTCAYYQIGESIEFEVISNIVDEKRRRKILLNNRIMCRRFAAEHQINAHVTFTYEGNISSSHIIVKSEGLKLLISYKDLIEPYLSQISSGALDKGTELDFVFVKYNPVNATIAISMRPIIHERELKEERLLKTKISRGDSLTAEVIEVTKKGVFVHILDTKVTAFIPNDELSPNKVTNAADELFNGEQIEIVYTGDKNGRMSFSRKNLVIDIYDETLYDLSLQDLLSTMDIHTNRFIGKLIDQKGMYFLTDLMVISGDESDDNGKLLIDPFTGKCLIAKVDNRLRNFFCDGFYYEVTIDLANKSYRRKEGTPYQFLVSSNDIKEAFNPYYESVNLSFKQHTSPNTNTSVANLLEEVGQGLYTSKKRMFFELLQNADDSASEKGVMVKVQTLGEYFILTHDGYPFNKQDFESITSAAKSTKSAKKKKTGYKGIGFKSVFTNSNSVLIKSRGYEFAFNKSYDTYRDFKAFYFLVNDIENNAIEQEKFLHKFSKYYKEFRGVKDIPWQLLPIWESGIQQGLKGTIFNPRENVSIALKMNNDTLNEYENAVKEVFEEPRFMLFLRKTKRIQLFNNGNCFTIQKNVSADGKIIRLVNSFKEEGTKESYRIFPIEGIAVDNDAFQNAGILIKREERLNNRGDYESYLVRIDNDGKSLADVPYVPDRIASSTDTAISFALEIDKDGRVVPIAKNSMSLYAYLPMNDRRFTFPFYINADFIPNSSREGVQSDNPWNFFLFNNIGKKIVYLASSLASTKERNYLNLLPPEFLQSEGVVDEMLCDSFNRGYREALETECFILNDRGEKVTKDKIIFDDSDLSTYVGNDAFYTLIGNSKRLPNANIDSSILANGIFEIEKITREKIYTILTENIENVRTWIASTDNELQRQFFTWLALDEDSTEIVSLVPLIQFGNQWLSIKELINKDNYIVSSLKTIGIKDVLSELGFVCSDTIIDTHPLAGNITTMEEKSLFDLIKSKDTSLLSFQDRLRLVECCEHFDNVGEAAIANWTIFKNQEGSFVKMASMVAYREDIPKWLHSYMLNKDEYSEKLNKFLIKNDSILSTIVEPNISEILSGIDVYEIYSYFKNRWTNDLTLKLIKLNVSNIISLVEVNPETQKPYIQSLDALSLNSSAIYSDNTQEYKIIKIASSDTSCINLLRSKITIDGIALSSISLKDEFHVQYNNKKYEFHLSKILTTHSDSLKLSNVAKNFSNIANADIIFAQKESDPIEVYRNLFSNTLTKYAQLNVEQFCFLMLIGQSSDYNNISFSALGRYIRVGDEQWFLDVMDYCYDNELGDALSICLRTQNIYYPCGSLLGKFIDSDDYTLASERVPVFISNWVDSNEKKKFLKKLGVHGEEGNDIQRRVSFKANKFVNEYWNISDSKIIRLFFDWIKNSIELPVTGENQITILEKLFDVQRIIREYREEDFVDSSEWTNDLYLAWKKDSGVSIKIISGLLPYRGIYAGVHYFSANCGEYIYFKESNTIYISSNKEPASILTDVYADRTISVFNQSDWNKIFLVSANLIKDKDNEIAELKKIIEDLLLQKDDTRVSEVENPGNKYNRGNLPPEQRKQVNLEACESAYNYLRDIDGYDCSEWDYLAEGRVVKSVLYNGRHIVVVITSSGGGYIHLNPYAFAQLMENSENLLINVNGNKVRTYSFKELFEENPDVNLIFDSKVVTPKNFAELANKFLTSERTCFVIANPNYSASDEIKGFGLNEKMEGGKVITFLSENQIW